MVQRIERVQLDRQLAVRERLVRASLLREEVGIVRVRVGGVGIELEGALPLRLGAGPVPIIRSPDRRQRFVRPGGIAVQYKA